MEKTKLNAGRKETESRRRHLAPTETDARIFPGKPLPRGDIQINKIGLNEDVRFS